MRHMYLRRLAAPGALLVVVALITPACASAKTVLEMTNGGGPLPPGTAIGDISEFWLEYGSPPCQYGGRLGPEGEITVNSATKDVITITGQSFGWCFLPDEDSMTLIGLPWKVELKKGGGVTIKGAGKVGLRLSPLGCAYKTGKLTGHWDGGHTFSGATLALVARESNVAECPGTVPFTLWFLPETAGGGLSFQIEEVKT